jgi:hypothetical protein
VHSDMPITLSVSWNRFGIPFHVPPTNIILEVFLVPDGILVAKFLIPPAKGTCGSEDTCRYQITINSADIPAGNLMLIATDPLSEAFDRQMITVTGQGAGFPSLHAMVVRDRLFLGISVVLACILCAILTGLIRKSG